MGVDQGPAICPELPIFENFRQKLLDIYSFVVIRYILLVMVCGAFTGLLSAQQVTEAEVNRQKLFIEAEREKLLGNYDTAIGILRELHRQDSDNAAIAYELGRLYLANGDTEEAVRYLKMAIELDSSNEWYIKYLADVYQQNERNEEGAALYEELVTRHPDDQFLYFKWAFFLVKAGQIDKAIRVYDDLEKRIGLNEEIARRKHTLYLGQGDTRRAARVLEELIEAFPQVIEYRHLLATFHESRGNDNAARKVYEEILELDPSDARAQLAMTGQSNLVRDEVRMLGELRTIFERPDVEVDLKISQLYPFITKVAETGDRELADAALQLTDLMESVHNSDAKCFAAAGDLYYHSGRREEAVEKYRATIERDDNVYPVWEQLLNALYELGDYDALYQEANNALDLFPNRAAMQYYLAIGADGIGRYNDALDALSMADMIAGRDENLRGEVMALQGQVDWHRGDKTAAATAFTEALSLSAASAEVNYRYCLYLLESGQVDQALDYAQRAVAANPRQSHYTFALAQALYQEGEYQQAADALQTARNEGAANWIDALELTGDVQFQLKNTDEAVRWWQQAREISGPSERLDQKIANRSL